MTSLSLGYIQHPQKSVTTGKNAAAFQPVITLYCQHCMYPHFLVRLSLKLTQTTQCDQEWSVISYRCFRTNFFQACDWSIAQNKAFWLAGPCNLIFKYQIYEADHLSTRVLLGFAALQFNDEFRNVICHSLLTLNYMTIVVKSKLNKTTQNVPKTTNNH